MALFHFSVGEKYQFAFAGSAPIKLERDRSV
jgi:hypothetical protein